MAAAIGIPVLVAVSAPTALAVRTAEASGITLIAVAREDGFESFTGPPRAFKKNNLRSASDDLSRWCGGSVPHRA